MDISFVQVVFFVLKILFFSKTIEKHLRNSFDIMIDRLLIFLLIKKDPLPQKVRPISQILTFDVTLTKMMLACLRNISLNKL